jgi:hypothetical protein
VDPEQDILRSLRLIAIGGPEAGATWRALPPDLDLDEVWDEGRPLYPAVGARALELAPDHPRAAILAGVWRYTWTHNQIALGKLLDGLQDPRPLVQGRPANLLAYARTSGDVAFSPPPRPHHWAGPPERTMEVTFQRRSVRVPAPAEHALERLWSHQPIDAAWAMEHQAMDWDAFCDLARSRGLVRQITPVLIDVADLGGPALVPTSVLGRLADPPSRLTQFGRRGLRFCRAPRS